MEPLSHNLDPEDVPAGFTLGNPLGGGAPASGSDGSAAAASQKQQQQESILEQALTADARARLRRIQLVKPSKAAAVEAIICNMAMAGQLPGPITEDKLIQMLEQRNPPPNSQPTAAAAASGGGTKAQLMTSTSISIQRKKYSLDSDDDDNDDDLL